MEIEDVTMQESGLGAPSIINVLPPRKSARPQVNFKDMEAQHLSETIFFPGKAEWKPVQLTVYDFPLQNGHPVFEWMRRMYRPEPAAETGPNSVWNPVLTGPTDTLGGGVFGSGNLKRKVTLKLFDGCGKVIERWVYEHAYPQDINFGDLDMGSSEVLVADITLRYDRAYWENP